MPRSSLLSHRIPCLPILEIAAQFVLPVAAGRGVKRVAALLTEQVALMKTLALHASEYGVEFSVCGHLNSSKRYPK